MASARRCWRIGGPSLPAIVFPDHGYIMSAHYINVKKYMSVHLICYNSGMNEKRSRGRPPIQNPATERLPMVRVTPEQRQSYQKAAESEGMPMAGWIKRELDRAVDKWRRKACKCARQKI